MARLRGANLHRDASDGCSRRDRVVRGQELLRDDTRVRKSSEVRFSQEFHGYVAALVGIPAQNSKISHSNIQLFGCHGPEEPKSPSGYEATKWKNHYHVRLGLRKQTIEPTAAAHKDLFVGNVGFAIPKRTFAATHLNDLFGSIPAFEGARFRHPRMSGSG